MTEAGYWSYKPLQAQAVIPLAEEFPPIAISKDAPIFELKAHGLVRLAEGLSILGEVATLAG